MKSRAGAFVVHLRVRLWSIVRDPMATTVVVATGLSGLVLWPWAGATEVSALESTEYGLLLQWMWIWLWPAVPMSVIAGRVTGKGLDTAFSSRGLPALPVGPRARAVAEATIVMTAVVLTRLGECWLVAGPTSDGCIAQTLLGGVVMMPALVVWGIPAPTLGIFMLRPALVATAVLGFRQLLPATQVPGLIAAAIILLMLVLWLSPREIRVPDPGRTRGRTAPRWRQSGPPAVVLRRDAWARPLRVWGIPAAISMVVMIAALILDLRDALPAWGLFAAGELVLIAVLIPVLRPFDSKLFGMSLVGRSGARIGDELRAWSVLPVRPVAVLRCVWLHGLVLTGGLWLFMMAAIVTRTWVRFGAFGLRAADGGDLTIILLPTVVLVPMVAGFLVAAAAGDRLRTGLSGGLVLLAVHGNIIFFATLRALMGRESSLPVILDVLFLAIVMLVASVPPLGLLRGPRDGSDGVS